MKIPDIPSTTQGEAEATRVLNVEIPESQYWHVRRCATESRMSMKEFMAEFCKTATPFISEPATPDRDTESGKAPQSECKP